jgi:hypothetical protein
LWRAEGLEEARFHIRDMDKLRPAIVSLKLFANMNDPVGADVIPQRIEEFVAFYPDTRSKHRKSGTFTPAPHPKRKGPRKVQAEARAFPNLSIS